MFGIANKYNRFDENAVYISTDNAQQENTCKRCGHSSLGDTPDKCSSCGEVFKKPNK